MGQKLIDETGHRYGGLTVLSLTKDKNHRTAWLCQCDCGNRKVVRGPDLRKGKITSCGQVGCIVKKQRSVSFIDETGNKYGKLIVLRRDEQKTASDKTLWICQCDCGNICSITGESLRSGHTQSCGCYARDLSRQRQSKDITNLRFGKLIAIKRLNYQTPGGDWFWECQCDCGNLTEVRTHDLLSGNTKSCGCLVSWGEQKIQNFLLNNKINFKSQYKFPDLVSENGTCLRFDFALLTPEEDLIGLIEYQGEQHYKAIPQWGGEQALKKTQERDLLKKQYCQKNKIPLLYLTKEDLDYKQQISDFIINSSEVYNKI